MLHGWGPERKQTLLRKAYEALPAGGAVLVYDAVLDDARRENAVGLLSSLNMLIENEEGAEYTGADCQDWMRAVGFAATAVEPLAGPESMVVAIKRARREPPPRDGGGHRGGRAGAGPGGGGRARREGGHRHGRHGRPQPRAPGDRAGRPRGGPAGPAPGGVRPAGDRGRR